jgi:hypothetical protein
MASGHHMRGSAPAQKERGSLVSFVCQVRPSGAPVTFPALFCVPLG